MIWTDNSLTLNVFPTGASKESHYHVVLFAGGVISTQPAHRVLGVPLHHLPALRAGIPGADVGC